MRSFACILAVGVLGVVAAGLVGCGSGAETPPPYLNEDLGTQPGEILVPYEPPLGARYEWDAAGQKFRTAHKILQDPGQFPLPQVEPLELSAPTAEADGGAMIAPLAPEATAGAAGEAPAGAKGLAALLAGIPGAPGPDSVFMKIEDIDPSSGQVSEPLTAALQQIVDQLTGGDFAAIEGRMTDEAKSNLAGGLEARWNAVAEQLGAFKQLGVAVGLTVTKGDLVANVGQAPMEFERGLAILLVAFDETNQISELYLMAFSPEQFQQLMQQALQAAARGAATAPAGPGSGEAPPDAAEQMGQAMQVLTTLGPQADEVAQALLAGNFADVATKFNEQMKAALPAEQLEAAWIGTIQPLGAFQEKGDTDIKTVEQQGQKLYVAVVPLRFEQGAVSLQIIFDANNQIAGLFIRPAGPSPGATPSAPPSPRPRDRAPQDNNPGSPVGVYVAPGPTGTGF